MAYVYLNGIYHSDEKPLISSHDRGFLLGDGLFETLKYHNNEIIFFAEHIARLRSSAEIFSIPFLYTDKALWDVCLEILKLNQLTHGSAVLRLTLSRGAGERGLDFPKTLQPTVFITAAAYQPSTKPMTLYISPITRLSRSLLARHKTLNYLENIMVRHTAQAKGFDDGLFLNEKSHIACTSAANIFLVKDNSIMTPALTSGILPGIMRQRIIHVCKMKGIVIEEEEIDCQLILACEEVFITNSLIGLQSIAKIEEQEFSTGSNSMASHLISILQKM